ncbi:MAG: glutamate 5-kinase [Armatimonadetes bacterium]|nr:glutamate 5-kinase [Armatimonadota bacterium]MDW8122659.1 glutamate 5-kinase [Armatimonadota bacterium]
MRHTVVVKTGTSTLTGGTDRLDIAYMRDLVRQISSLWDEGIRTVLVTSGAIRTGIGALSLKEPLSLVEKQAAASVGQGLLMATYRELFEHFGKKVGQILLTRADVEARESYLNARRTFQQLFRWSVVPIVNENDTVATEEIRWGDNDILAALTALVTDADLLILLSDVDGFYARRPRKGDPSPPVIEEVRQITDDLWAKAGSGGPYGSGGMITKLQSASIMMECGIEAVVANGRTPDVILRLIKGERLGTRFVPIRRLPARKRWLAFVPRVMGQIVVNEGARRSILEKGTSLLPAGVVTSFGQFSAGDVVALTDEEGRVFAKGLTNYSSDQVLACAGLTTDQLPDGWGKGSRPEVVHRDNLVLISPLSSYPNPFSEMNP